MKFFLAIVSTVCLMGGIYAQTGYITDAVSAAIAASQANLASAIQQVNSSVTAADQGIVDSWTQLGQGLIALYNSYYDQFKVYTTIDLSPLTSAISSMQSMLTQKPSLIRDDTYNVEQIFTDAQTSAQQIQDALNAAATNMTAAFGSACSNPYAGKCAKKYAGQLSRAPISIDRVAACVSAEEDRFASIGSDVAAHYSRSLPMAMNYMLLVNMCDIPPPEVLNDSSATMGPPSTQCFQNYLSRASSVSMFYSTGDAARWAQTQMVSFRSKRCVKLVSLDVQDRVKVVVDKFYNCLTTGV